MNYRSGVPFVRASFVLVTFLAGFARAQAPSITSQPAARTVVTKGQSTALSVVATGATSYQWKRSGRAIAGATTASYTINNAAPIADNGWYQVVVTNSSGATTSTVAFVVVAPVSTQVIAVGTNAPSVPVGLIDAVAVAGAWAGGGAAIKADGTVLGFSITLPTLSNVVRIAAGGLGGVAIKADGLVVGWGNFSAVPAGLNSVVDISIGYDHAVALKADGTVVTWGGDNYYGQLNVPFGLSSVVGIAAGYGSSLALKVDGNVVAWGGDALGGVVPSSFTGVVAIAATFRHCLAIKADGTVVAWGGAVPSGISNAVAAAAGENISLVVRADGTVATAGPNKYGELNLPTGLNNVFGVAASGGPFSMLLRDATGDLAPTINAQPVGGTVFAGQEVILSVQASAGTALLRYQWRKGGVDIAGATADKLTLPHATSTDAGEYDVLVSTRLGSVATQSVSLAVSSATAVVTNPSGQQQLAPGQTFVVSATTAISGTVNWEWRRNGRMIPGATSADFSVNAMTWRDAGAYQAVATNALGKSYSAAVFVSLTTPSQVRAWGSNSSGQTTVPAGLPAAMAVGAGRAHSIALKSDGTLVSWGDNTYGQCNFPVGFSDFVAIAAGGDSSLALQPDGSLIPWGEVNYLPATLVGARVTAFATGYSHDLALRSDGTVISWDARKTRTDVPSGLTNVTALSAGYEQSIALLADGTVVGWGQVATPPVGLSNVKAIAAGTSHNLALRTDGTVVAWGSDDYGESTVPAGLNDVVAIAAIANASYALRNNGSVVM